MPIPQPRPGPVPAQVAAVQGPITMAVARVALIEAIDRALLAGMTGPDIMAVVHQRIDHHQRQATRATAAPHRRPF